MLGNYRVTKFKVSRSNMAALVEGLQYGLSSVDSSNINRSVVHVKLTDSSLRCIEEFLKTRNGKSKKPNIQFDGSQGVITIPDAKDAQVMRSFRFSLSSIQGDPNGSFDCIKQPDINFGNQMESLGSMSQKMQVQATNEVYKETREKMSLAEEEVKKNCAKEIKPGGKYIGHRVKKVIKDSASKDSIMKSLNQSAISKTVTSNTNSISQRVSSSNQRLSQSSSHKLSPSQCVPSRNNASSVHASSALGSRSQPKPSSQSTSANIKKPNPAIMGMPYRDRIIHLLALKSYKKPELLVRLKQDGIPKKDENSLGTILQQVAVLNTKDNSYTLAKHVYCDVKAEWPFYNESDKQLVRKKLQIETKSTSSSPVPSPVSENKDIISTVITQKRPNETAGDVPPNKKQRISHYGKIKKENKLNGFSHKRPDVISDKNQENIKDFRSTKDSLPEYVHKYILICTTDQRQKYKQDFNSEYEEYRNLHANVEKVSKKFLDLDEKLRKTKQGTPDYENLKNRIFKEYQQQKNDEKFIEQKKHYQYLHQKLGHIKKLIVDYDQKHFANS